MGYGQQNPLVAPTQANTALPPPTRAPWSPYEFLQTLIGLVLLVFAGLQAVPTIRSVAPAVSNVYGAGLLVLVVVCQDMRLVELSGDVTGLRESGSASAS